MRSAIKIIPVLIVTFIFFFGDISGQDYMHLKLGKPDRSFYSLTTDSSALNLKSINEVTTTLGFSPFTSTRNSFIFKGIKGIAGVYYTAFSVFPITIKADTLLRIEDKSFFVNKDSVVYIYGFTSQLYEGKKVDKNFSNFLMSAYLQEQDPEYANNNTNFSNLLLKDKSEFWKRNWINMGYGLSYLAKDNPFMGNEKFAIGFLYTWEALHYIPIFAGPFIGESTNDKITIPIVGICSLLIWKTLFSGLIIGNKYLKFNKKIHNSGYKIPNYLE